MHKTQILIVNIIISYIFCALGHEGERRTIY